MMLTFELVNGTNTSKIMKEYGFGSNTLADWRPFVNEVILDYVEENSQMIGGRTKL